MTRLPPIPEDDLPLMITTVPLEYRFPLLLNSNSNISRVLAECLREFPRPPRVLILSKYRYISGHNRGVNDTVLNPQELAPYADVDVLSASCIDMTLSRIVPHYDVIVVSEVVDINSAIEIAAQTHTLIIVLGIMSWSREYGWHPIGNQFSMLSPTHALVHNRPDGGRDVINISDNQITRERRLEPGDPIFLRNV